MTEDVDQRGRPVVREPAREPAYLDQLDIGCRDCGATYTAAEGHYCPPRSHHAWCWLPADHEGLCEGDQ